ncbi:MAG: type II secretion system protein GspG [Verrucomicrobiota bacterium]
MKITKRPGRAAFTLIELMAVITIIVILAGLVVGGLGYVTEKQASSKAKLQIALISKALEEYKNEMGQYPPTANNPAAGSTATSLYSALFYEGYDYSQNPAQAPATPPKATKIYLADLDPTTSKQGWMDPVTTGTNPKPPAPSPTKTMVKDPWGTEYKYRSAFTSTGTANTATQNPDFDLWSCGKDGLTGTAATSKDDIKNY